MSKVTPKYLRYLCLLPNGDWEEWKLPHFMASADLQRHRGHSDVFMLLPHGWNVFGNDKPILGERWVKWVNRENGYYIPLDRDPRQMDPNDLLLATADA